MIGKADRALLPRGGVMHGAQERAIAGRAALAPREGRMLLLVLIAVVTAAALFLVGRAMAGAVAETGVTERAVAFFRAQRAEIARQKAAGLLSDAEAIAADREAARRLLAAEASVGPAPAAPLRRSRFAFIAIALAVPAASLVLYGRIGAPHLPDQPLAARALPKEELDIAAAVARIEAHLAQNPNDARGHEILGPIYLRIGRFADAATTFERLVTLLGPNAERLGALGEARVFAAGGVITAEARQAFAAAVTAEAKAARPRFYLALAEAQDGRIADAISALTILSAEVPEGPARQRIAAELARLGSPLPEAGHPSPAPSSPSSPSPPETPAGAAIANLPPAERAAAIRGMVEGLDARLRQSGGSAEDWSRLVRSYMILGERAAAEAALARAAAALTGDDARAIEGLAREFGFKAGPG